MEKKIFVLFLATTLVFLILRPVSLSAQEERIYSADGTRYLCLTNIVSIVEIGRDFLAGKVAVVDTYTGGMKILDDNLSYTSSRPEWFSDHKVIYCVFTSRNPTKNYSS